MYHMRDGFNDSIANRFALASGCPYRVSWYILLPTVPYGAERI